MQDLPTRPPWHVRGIILDDVDGGDEYHLVRKRLNILALVTTCVDTSVHLGLLQVQEQEGSWEVRARLQEIVDAEVDHTWMFRWNLHHGAVMKTDEYVDSVRLRLPDHAIHPLRCLSDRIRGRVQPTRPAARWSRPRAATRRCPR